MGLWCEKGGLEKLKSIPDRKIIVFDTETTGVDTETDEILQLGIIDGGGQILFNEYIKPVHKKSWPKAQAVNHISPAMVKNKPDLGHFKRQILEIFPNAELIIGYNLEFDLEFLRQEGITPSKEAYLFDVMLEFAPVYGRWNDYFEEFKWAKLSDCAAHYKYTFEAHDAVEDCKATLYCYKAMLEDNAPRGYLEICQFCKGKPVSLWADERKDRRESEREYSEITYYKRNAENNPIFDEIDDTIFSCFIRGTSWPSGEVTDTDNDMQIRKATLNRIEEICKEKGGKLYKSRAKGAKWAVIGQTSLCIFDETEELHNLGYKVARWPEFLEYLGINEGWDLNLWRKRCIEHAQYIRKNNRKVSDQYIESLRRRAYPGTSGLDTVSNTKKDVPVQKQTEKSVQKNPIPSVDDGISVPQSSSVIQISQSGNKAVQKPATLSALYKKICDKITAEETIDAQNIITVASNACLYGRDLAWLFFAVRNEMALGLLNSAEEDFFRVNRKYFPTIPKDVLLMRRKQAMQWINDPNVFQNQIRIIQNSSYEERYVMLIRNYLERGNIVDPPQQINNAFAFLQYFFNPSEQQYLWNSLCNELNNKKQKAIDRLRMINNDFASYQTAKGYLTLFIDNLNITDYEISNPYNFFANNSYFRAALADSQDNELCIKLLPYQAWIWNVSVDNIYEAAVHNIRDRRTGKNDGEILVRQILPQYFKK